MKVNPILYKKNNKEILIELTYLNIWFDHI